MEHGSRILKASTSIDCSAAFILICYFKIKISVKNSNILRHTAQQGSNIYKGKQWLPIGLHCLARTLKNFLNIFLPIFWC